MIINVGLEPWGVPHFVRYFVKEGHTHDCFSHTESVLELCDVDAETLSEQCDIFRAEVFRKAGKADPKAIKEEENG